MTTIMDIHVFLECNLPEYERRDVLRVLKFYVSEEYGSTKRPIVRTLSNFQRFKVWITKDLQGIEKISNKKLPKVKPDSHEEDDEPLQRCKCGSHMVIRTNREKGNKFYGCSNYPECRNTLPI